MSLLTDGCAPRWDKTHARWLREYGIPVHPFRIARAIRQGCHLRSLRFANASNLPVEALFITRGDIYFNKLAKMLGAKISGGEIAVNAGLCTSVLGLYAAGCVTAANCQMIIAAGQGATAAQSMNRALFKQGLITHSLQKSFYQPTRRGASPQPSRNRSRKHEFG